MTIRSTCGRALFYTRDSEGRSEYAPPQYVNWAQIKAREFGVAFSGTPTEMERMMRERSPECGDLFLDYGVSGNLLSRPGLDALRRVAEHDLNVSHILIPRRDRLIRPDDPVDGWKLEVDLRKLGITLVVTDKILPPIRRGQRLDIADLLSGLLDYDNSGRFRRELAEKLLQAQVRLATSGFSIGGSAPYGFERWFVSLDGIRVRTLLKGEYTKLAGHHVVWLPTAVNEIEIVLRVFDLIEKTSASKIARILTDEGIPPPVAGHGKSGIWHQSTIRNIVRNKIYIALREYGKRSEGDQQRFTPNGPRALNSSDYHLNGKEKTVINPLEARIVTPQKFEAIIEPNRFEGIQLVLDKRGRSQRGKPRAKGCQLNPLGTRIYDMACGWPMYRLSRKGKFSYTCSAYQQSHAQLCRHNSLPGIEATKFVLGCIRQQLLSTTLLGRLEKRLFEFAEHELGESSARNERKNLESELQVMTKQLSLVEGNMARAKSDEQFEAISKIFEGLLSKQREIQKKPTELEQTIPTRNVDLEVANAMRVLDQLKSATLDGEDLSAATDLFQVLNVRLFVKFREVDQGRRKFNKLVGGVVTFGSAPSPISLYQGPTDRGMIRKQLAAGDMVSLLSGDAAPKGCPNGSEEDSSGNVVRGTKRRT